MKVIGSRRVWSLEEVTAAVAARFEDVRAFWVEAEIEDVRRAGSQVYFRLRGQHVMDASMRAVVFDRIVPRPGEGMLVHAHGRVEFFRQRSRVSMRVEVMEPAGEGLLRARIAELRARLVADGVLDPARRRPVPVLAREIGVVTSLTGAARDDFVRTAVARNPGVRVAIAGTQVQGDDAPVRIARAVARAGAEPQVDVVVVTRGGGSLDDLMAFNSEPVCRAVAACPVPVVSAVGHERDVTLCDEVADLRCATPTAAAVAVTISREAALAHLADAQAAMAAGVERIGAAARRDLGEARAGLADGLRRAGTAGRGRLEGRSERLHRGLARAAHTAGELLPGRSARMERAMENRLAAARSGLARAEGLLGALSPAATLSRGYAIVRSEGRVVTDGAPARPGDRWEVELHDGRVGVRVEGDR
ncbi:MAG: exodeoxyribonuclease VII large subunit [Acidimicrobiales bacterium]